MKQTHLMVKNDTIFSHKAESAKEISWFYGFIPLNSWQFLCVEVLIQQYVVVMISQVISAFYKAFGQTFIKVRDPANHRQLLIKVNHKQLDHSSLLFSLNSPLSFDNFSLRRKRSSERNTKSF